MGKKKIRSKMTSKGERRSSYGVRDSADKRLANKMKALYQGKDVTFTVANPNKNETNRPFIKYKVSGKAFLEAMKNADGTKASAISILNGGAR